MLHHWHLEFIEVWAVTAGSISNAEEVQLSTAKMITGLHRKYVVPLYALGTR